MSLPPPSANQAFCDVSALEAGHVKIPLAWVLANVSEDEFLTLPALAFLVRHRSDGDTVLFDLGLRKGWQILPQSMIDYLVGKLHFEPNADEDVVDSLAKGGANAQELGLIVVANLFCAILMRQDYVINAFFTVACAVPRS